jgi:hypothetical protein
VHYSSRSSYDGAGFIDDSFGIAALAEAQADRDGPRGLREAAIQARFDGDLTDAAHADEGVAHLRRQAHFAGDALAHPALPRFAADEDQALHSLGGEG